MKTTNREFSQMIDQMKELKDSGHVWVEVERLEKFCDLCRGFGFNPQGGALSNDCSRQVIYIDRPTRDAKRADTARKTNN